MCHTYTTVEYGACELHTVRGDKSLFLFSLSHLRHRRVWRLWAPHSTGGQIPLFIEPVCHTYTTVEYGACGLHTVRGDKSLFLLSLCVTPIPPQSMAPVGCIQYEGTNPSFYLACHTYITVEYGASELHTVRGYKSLFLFSLSHLHHRRVWRLCAAPSTWVQIPLFIRPVCRGA